MIALTREVSLGIWRCQLTHLERQRIDVERAREQHGAYEDLLQELGCELARLPAEPDLPDGVFVEDTAVVLDELAVIARPGAEERRPETASAAQVLRRYRKLADITGPATLDGGDVLVADRTVWAGLSTRTNREAVVQLAGLLEPYGYAVRPVEFGGCLHLKSAITRVGENLLLFNPDWIDPRPFAPFDFLEVDPSEPHAANVLWLEGPVVVSAAYPRTRARLEERGVEVHPLDISELAKAEGAVTCCSLILRS